MKTDMSVDIKSHESPDDVKRVSLDLMQSLDTWNDTNPGVKVNMENWAYTIEEDGNIVGGVAGRDYYNWTHVDVLFVNEAYRGRDFGRALLEKIENHARAAGMRGIELYTSTFQAPGLYLKMGFSEAGRHHDNPPGHDKIFFSKSL
jgi:GNAT superfamily N-acetyltransferase